MSDITPPAGWPSAGVSTANAATSPIRGLPREHPSPDASHRTERSAARRRRDSNSELSALSMRSGVSDASDGGSSGDEVSRAALELANARLRGVLDALARERERVASLERMLTETSERHRKEVEELVARVESAHAAAAEVRGKEGTWADENMLLKHRCGELEGDVKRLREAVLEAQGDAEKARIDRDKAVSELNSAKAGAITIDFVKAESQRVEVGKARSVPPKHRGCAVSTVILPHCPRGHSIAVAQVLALSMSLVGCPSRPCPLFPWRPMFSGPS